MELALEAVQHNARLEENPQNSSYIDNLTETAAPATALRVRGQMKRDQLRQTMPPPYIGFFLKYKTSPFQGHHSIQKDELLTY